MLSPRALSLTIAEGVGRREDWLDEQETLALKTWLGLRYDRPAIPENLVPLARSIAASIEKRKADPALRQVREILAQFDVAPTPPLFRLFAIVLDGADKARVRDVLIDAALEVPIELGVMDRAIVGSTGEISVEVLETSFAVDLTQITWASGRPDGAS